MKTAKYFLALIAVAAILPVAAQKAQPEITFERTTINLGTFPAEEAIKICHFVFTNTGNADLYIHQAFASCGCTAVQTPEGAIKPGASDTITIRYDGRRKAPGKMRKSVTIHNNSQNEMIKLYITGKMLPVKEQKVEEIIVEE